MGALHILRIFQFVFHVSIFNAHNGSVKKKSKITSLVNTTSTLRCVNSNLNAGTACLWHAMLAMLFVKQLKRLCHAMRAMLFVKQLKRLWHAMRAMLFVKQL